MLLEAAYLEKNRKKYKSYCSTEQWQHIQELVEKLKDKNIVHVNATPIGGGVAEILQSLVPLQKSFGLDSKWVYMQAPSEFFAVTKKMHNSLQGSKDKLTNKEKDLYREVTKRLASDINDLRPDILILHDPQPLGAAAYVAPMPIISRIHIDLTEPNEDTYNFIKPFFGHCKKIIFSADEYVSPQIPSEKVLVSPPAIDPLCEKDEPLSPKTAQKICRQSGIDTKRPILLQVSRFDPWKDPLGVMEVYRLIKREVPAVQLVLSGVIEAQDDPEAFKIIEDVKRQADGDEDIHLFYSLNQLPDGVSLARFINALQTLASAVFQKSLREGFGLTTTEALWKYQPVVAGNAIGQRLQIKNCANGFLTSTLQEAAEKAMLLLENAEIKHEMGERAHSSVLEKFLITRLLLDELEAMSLL